MNIYFSLAFIVAMIVIPQQRFCSLARDTTRAMAVKVTNNPLSEAMDFQSSFLVSRESMKKLVCFVTETLNIPIKTKSAYIPFIVKNQKVV